MSAVSVGAGTVAWAGLEPIRGREQGGFRPVLVASSPLFLDAVTTLAIVLPITAVERGWPNHVRTAGESGLARESWIMTEQPRTIARERIVRVTGSVSDRCLDEVRVWLRDFLDL